MNLIVVTWHDAEDVHDTWSDAKEIEAFGDSIMEVTSVGWEVKRTKLYLTIAADYTPDGTFGRVTKIPIGMVQNIKELEL